jgi:hypothetical protein
VWDAPALTEHGGQWIKIQLDYPVNPWAHQGAGSITWGANLDRLAPLGEEAVSIIKEAWGQREHPRERTKREQDESSTGNRTPAHRSNRVGPGESNSGSTGST